MAGFTCVETWPGCVYTVLVIDAFSRVVVGWRVATSTSSDIGERPARCRRRFAELLYLGLLKAQKKSTRAMKNWSATLNRFAICFDGRLPV
jgi:hypothetical protein